VRDFNLIVERSRARAATEVLHLDGRSIERVVEAGWLLVFCAEGTLSAGSFEAETGDTIQLAAGRHRLDGENALALVMSVHMLRGK
jgi:HutD